MLEENKSLSIRQWSPQVSLSATTVWRTLRFDLSAKFYRPSTVQPLSESHVEQRKNFCTWLLQQPACFVQNVIWTDEKIFALNQRPNYCLDYTSIKSDPKRMAQWSRVSNPITAKSACVLTIIRDTGRSIFFVNFVHKSSCGCELFFPWAKQRRKSSCHTNISIKG